MTATPTPEPLITLRDVTVGYANQDVVSGASLAIPAGAFVAFVGPNGAGKTTLLRAILGLIPLRRGAILTPFRRSPPGYVPQARVVDPLYPVSLRDIASMGLYPRLGPLRRPSPGHRRLVDQTLQRFDLAQHARKAWRELSGGMKQKTLIARAIVADPRSSSWTSPPSNSTKPPSAKSSTSFAARTTNTAAPSSSPITAWATSTPAAPASSASTTAAWKAWEGPPDANLP